MGGIYARTLGYHQCDDPRAYWWEPGLSGLDDDEKVLIKSLTIRDWLVVYLYNPPPILPWPGHWSPLTTPGPDNVRKLSSVCFPRHGSLCRRGERREREAETFLIPHCPSTTTMGQSPSQSQSSGTDEHSGVRTVQTGSTEITGLLTPSTPQKSVL